MITNIICILATLVFSWVLTPCLFSQPAAALVVVLIGASLILMLLDRGISRGEFRRILIVYGMCGLLSLFLWLIGQRDYHPLIEYGANSAIVWYPVAFAYYVLYRKPEARVLRFMILAILLATCITGITTLIGLQEYPLGSRWLAGGHTEEVRATLRSMNVGGYGYIYMLAVTYPIIVGVAFTRVRFIWPMHTLALICVILAPVVILYSQYMVALYMNIYSVAVIVLVFAIGLIVWKATKNVRANLIYLAVIPAVAVAFFMFLTPINNLIGSIVNELGLGSLQARAADVIKTQISANSTKTPYMALETPAPPHKETPDVTASPRQELRTPIMVEPTAKVVKPTFEIVEQVSKSTWMDSVPAQGGSPVRGRLGVYLRVVHSFPISPVFGRLSDSRTSLSYHSDFLDGLLGGGIVGGLFFLCMLYGIFVGLVRRVRVPNWLLGNLLLSLCLLFGLGFVNTVFLSREIIMMSTLLPVLVSEVHDESGRFSAFGGGGARLTSVLFNKQRSLQ